MKVLDTNYKETNLDSSERKAAHFIQGNVTSSGMASLKRWKKISFESDGGIKMKDAGKTAENKGLLPGKQALQKLQNEVFRVK